MQQTHLGRLVRCLMAVAIMVCTLALVACPGDDDEEIRNISTTVPANASTAQIIVNEPVTLNTGTVLNAAAAPASLTLTAPTAFRFTQQNQMATGNVTYSSSCTLLIQTSTFPAGQGPQVGQSFFFPTCDFRVGATGVEVDGDEVVGSLTVVLVRSDGVSATSTPISVEVRINSDGILFIDDIMTGVDTDVTGTTGTTP